VIRRLLSLLAAHREAAELRVLLDCARADLGSLRRELDARQADIARLTGAAAAERVAQAEALRACEVTWAHRVEVAEAEARDLNGRLRVLVGERDNAIAETHATRLALRRAEQATADTKRAQRGKA